MTLHTKGLSLEQIRSIVDNSKNLFHLAEINKYVKDKTIEYSEANNVVKTGEYCILSQYISKRMNKLLSKPGAFRVH